MKVNLHSGFALILAKEQRNPNSKKPATNFMLLPKGDFILD